MAKFNSKRTRREAAGVVQQEAHIWQKEIERGVSFHEVGDIVRNIALINRGACAATRSRDVCERILLPYLRKKIPLGGGRVENESCVEDDEEKSLILVPTPSEHGADNDHLSYFCVHDAEVYGMPSWEGVKVEGGAVLDRTSPSSSSTASSWEPRPLPLTCVKCEVTCDSHAAFLEHCALYSHKQALADTPVPETFVDPRCLDDVGLELHELPRAVVAWRDRVYTFLRTIDDAGMARMGKIAAESHDQMEESGRDLITGHIWWDRENAIWTAEKAHKDILEYYVLEDFRRYGLWPGGGESYAMSIIHGGWAAFDFLGTHDWRMFNAGMATTASESGH